MNNNKLKLMLLVIFIFNFIYHTYSNESQNRMWVIVKSGVYLRESSNIKSKIICLIPFGKDVFLLNEKRPEKINKINGNWQKVKYNNLVGWSFDGYLDKMSYYDDKGNSINKKFGNYRLLGIGYCREGLFGGWSYNLLLYKNKPIDFVHSFDPINNDTGLVIETSLGGVTIGDEDIPTISIGEYSFVLNGEFISANKLLSNFNYFSSPNVIEQQVYYWGIDNINIYAMRYNFNTKETKKVFLYKSYKNEFATDNMRHFIPPEKKNNTFIFETDYGNKYILNSDFELLKDK